MRSSLAPLVLLRQRFDNTLRAIVPLPRGEGEGAPSSSGVHTEKEFLVISPRPSDFGLRNSFGFRISTFGFQTIHSRFATVSVRSLLLRIADQAALHKPKDLNH